LLDSGGKKKLEDFNQVRIVRFEPEAVWKPSLPQSIWKNTHARYTYQGDKKSGAWHISDKTPRNWPISIGEIRAELNISNSPHIGIFPEQVENWRWIAERIMDKRKPIRVLNLFAYTGLSTLFAARAGASVTHVDASIKAIRMGKKNAEMSLIPNDRIRWIIDDAQKFVNREIKREKIYDAIILDPPLFGKGPKGEIWKFDTSLPVLMESCKKLIAPQPIFLLLTAYNIPDTPRQLAEIVSQKMAGLPGVIEYGYHKQKEISAGRIIKQSIYVRWSKG